MKKTALSVQSLIYIGAAATAALVPFLVLPLLTRWLGPEGFGTVGVLLAMISVCSMFIGFGTHTPIGVRYFQDGPESLPRYVSAALVVMAISAIPLMAVLQLNAQEIERLTGIPPEWLWVIGVSASGQFVLTVTLAVWQVRQQAFRYGITQIGFNVLWATLSIVLIGWIGMNWTGRALGQGSAAVIAAILCFAFLAASGCIERNPRRWPIRSALQFGLPLLPHSMAAIAMTTIDRFALTSYVGEAATGHYFAAFQIASVISALGAAVNQAWVPWLFQRLARSEPESNREIVYATYIIYVLLLSGAATMVVGSKLLVHLVAGPDFAQSAELLIFLAPAAAFTGMYYFVTNYLFFASRTGVLSVITVAIALLQTALTLWLVKQAGMKGVALASLLSAFTYWAVIFVVANHFTPMPWIRARA